MTPPELLEQAPEAEPTPPTSHLELPERELEELAKRIGDNYSDAQTAHRQRMNRIAGGQDRWRQDVGGSGGTQGKSNFNPKIVAGDVFIRWARDMDALLGDDAEIIAKPVGRTDKKTAERIALYMDWRVFEYMDITLKLCQFDFNRLMNGRAHAYCPWERKTYITGDGVEEVYYDGPAFYPIEPNDLIVPTTDALLIDDFPWKIRRYYTTPDEMLAAEGSLYAPFSEDREFWVELNRIAKETPQRKDQDAKSVRDAQEGKQYEGSGAAKGQVEIWEWYGKWNLPVEGEPEDGDTEHREMRQKEIVVRYMPAMNPASKRIRGIQDLTKIYPTTPKRCPIVEAALTEDGSYWCAGIPELVGSIEDEITKNYNLSNEGAEAGIFPPIGYKPASGATPERLRLEPRLGIPLDNPLQDLKQIDLKVDLNGMVIMEQRYKALKETLLGVSDFTAGRGSDRPNAPRTARATLALMQAGDIRLGLDTKVLRKYMGKMLSWFWTLERMFGSPETFFRVTESEAEGLFDPAESKDGFAQLTAEERAHPMDFNLKFATNIYSREARKEQALALFGVLSRLPLFMTSARAQFMLADSIGKEFGYDITEFIPKPPEEPQPIEPIDEWTLMLEGRDVQINPLDNHAKHIQEHKAQVLKMYEQPPEKQDADAMYRNVQHTMEHERALVVAQQAAAQFVVALEEMKKQIALDEEGEGGGPKKAKSNGGEAVHQQPKPAPMGAEAGGALSPM